MKRQCWSHRFRGVLVFYLVCESVCSQPLLVLTIISPPRLQGSLSREGMNLLETSYLHCSKSLCWPWVFLGLLLSAQCLTFDLCICYHLIQEEAFLIVTEQDTDLWLQQIVTRSHSTVTFIYLFVRLFWDCSIWFYPRSLHLFKFERFKNLSYC